MQMINQAFSPILPLLLKCLVLWVSDGLAGSSVLTRDQGIISEVLLSLLLLVLGVLVLVLQDRPLRSSSPCNSPNENGFGNFLVMLSVEHHLIRLPESALDEAQDTIHQRCIPTPHDLHEWSRGVLTAKHHYPQT